MDPDNRTKEPPLAGDPPNPINPPSGCRFHTRCRFAESVCKSAVPRLQALPDGDGHLVACHLHDLTSGHSKAGKEVMA
jgi:peptide/nickel transport system ATP-binding protein